MKSRSISGNSFVLFCAFLWPKDLDFYLKQEYFPLVSHNVNSTNSRGSSVANP